MSRTRQYAINETFFSRIDTENKAYILGFLYADGHNNLKKGRFTIALQARDRDILVQMRTAMNSKHPIHIRTYMRKDGYSVATKGMKTSAYLEISSRQMCDDLNRLGCGQKKTARIRFPKWIRKSLIRHFMRGLFDGDGCIAKRTNGRHTAYIATLTGNPKMVLGVRTLLARRFKQSFFVAKPKEKKVFVLMMSGNRKCEQFLSWMYKDAKIALLRKQTLYKELVNRVAIPLGKPITMHNRKTDNVIHSYPSQTSMAKALDVSRSTVCYWLSGHINTPKEFYVK